MRTLRTLALAATLAALLPTGRAQDTLTTAGTADSSEAWTLNGSVLAFLYRDTIALINPAFTADHKNLHLEARYQWEDWRTGSVWAGRWFTFGNELEVNVAPMVGAVFGLTKGVAPGYTIDASWRSLSFYSSSEYVFNLEDEAYNFAYTWTEMSVDLDHLLVGLVVQRTRTFDSPLDLQKGLLLLREQGDFTFGMYLFNAFFTDPTVTISLAYEFETASKPRPTKIP